MAQQVLNLSPEIILSDRAFTHPDHHLTDLPVLRVMLHQLGRFLEPRSQIEEQFESKIIPEADGRRHRYLIPRPTRLAAARNMIVVGFFGQRRPEIPVGYFAKMDKSLREEIPQHRAILSYSCMELKNGDFSNLVLLENEAVKEAWREGDNHLKAIDQSPRYYKSVRIYNGRIEKDVYDPESLQLLGVKYWDYDCQPTWRAVRPLTNASLL